jgi:hypothetical protein
MLSHGASVHRLPALQQFPGNKWLEIAMIRVIISASGWTQKDHNTSDPGNISEVVTHVKQVSREGVGVVSMKLVGEGASFTKREDYVRP